MLRRTFIYFALLAATLTVANGCQSCSSCHDYDPPVANCHCGGCSQCACNGGCSSCGCNSGYSSCGCNDGCSSCNGGATMQPTDSEQVVPQGNTQSSGTR
jgi:hypothetical protein